MRVSRLKLIACCIATVSALAAAYWSNDPAHGHLRLPCGRCGHVGACAPQSVFPTPQLLIYGLPIAATIAGGADRIS